MGAARGILSRLSPKTIAVVLVVALVAVLGYFLVLKEDTKTGTAYFTSATNIYEGDPIEILGVKVGKIDKITPTPEHVKVEFTYEAKYKVPADAKAAVISPSLIPARYIQLAPAYTGGPVLEDGGVIPIERTAVPVEFDELKKQLSEVTKTFGPEGANENGALNRVLELGTIYKGQGKPYNTFVKELSKAVETLGQGSGDMFSTIRNLQQFSTVLVQFEDAITEFGTRLDEVTGILDQDKDQLVAALTAIDKMMDEGFSQWGQDIQSVIMPFANEANEVLANFARQRDTLAQILHIGPTVLQNFSNIISTKTGGVQGWGTLATFGSSGGSYDPICSQVVSSIANNVKDAQDFCVQYMGPLFTLFNKIPYPAGAPLGLNVLQSPGGGSAQRTDPLLGDAQADGNDGIAGPDPYPSSRSVIPPAFPSDGLGGLLGLGGN